MGGKKGYTHFADNDAALAKIAPFFENGKLSLLDCDVEAVAAG